MADALIMACSVGFQVHTAVMVTIKGAVVMGGTAYIMGFIGIPPASQKDIDATTTTKLQHLQRLDQQIFQIIGSKEYYRNLANMPGFIDQMILTTSAVNAVSEQVGFLADGLAPSPVFDSKYAEDVLTARLLVYDVM